MTTVTISLSSQVAQGLVGACHLLSDLPEMYRCQLMKSTAKLSPPTSKKLVPWWAFVGAVNLDHSHCA
jgi:hypothetical protein